MAVRLTAAQAKALGVGAGVSYRLPTPTPTRKKARKAAPVKDCGPNRCCTCGEVFTGETAERRHADTLRHLRFEMVM